MEFPLVKVIAGFLLGLLVGVYGQSQQVQMDQRREQIECDLRFEMCRGR